MDVQKPVEVSFTEVCAATRQASENAHLVFADLCLAAILLPAEWGWFLQTGFGPCDHEAVFFDTLPSTAEWVQKCFTAAASVIGSRTLNVVGLPVRA